MLRPLPSVRNKRRNGKGEAKIHRSMARSETLRQWRSLARYLCYPTHRHDQADPSSSKSGISKVALIGIALGTIAGAVTLSAIVSLLILRLNTRKRHTSSRRHLYLPS
ncbi:unnamed protein product [Camellia sinensis]